MNHADFDDIKILAQIQRSFILKKLPKNSNYVGSADMRGRFFLKISEKGKNSVAVILNCIEGVVYSILIKPTQF